MDTYSHQRAGVDREMPIVLRPQRGLDKLGWDFRRLYPIDETPRFAALLRAIDETGA